MNIVRVRADEMAAPVLALEVDGAIYDVVTLEEHWGVTPWSTSGDFHARVFSARAAGLDSIDARLRSGDRPTAARLLTPDLLPLPPCDTDRTTYVQVAPQRGREGEPRFVVQEARSMVGDGQPVPLRGGPRVELGVAVLLGDDLYDATPREAARAVLGLTLLADWSPRDRWASTPLGPDGPTQLGPAIVTGLALRDLVQMEAKVQVGDAAPQSLGPVGGNGWHPSEVLAFISRAVPLRTGDVVGLGAVAVLAPRFGERLRLSVRGRTRQLGALHGWAVPAPSISGWRLK